MNPINRISLAAILLIGLPAVALSQPSDCTRDQVKALMKSYPTIRLSVPAQSCWDGQAGKGDCDELILDELENYRKKDESLWKVSHCTRTKVESVVKEYPKFRLSPDAQSCLDDQLKDVLCEPTILGEVDIYRRKQEVERRNQEVERREQQLVTVKVWRTDSAVVMGLSQLAFFVFFDRSPPANADFITMASQDPLTPPKIRALIGSYLARKKSGSLFSYEADGKPLMALAQTHFDMAKEAKNRVTDPVFISQMTAMNAQAGALYIAVRDQLKTLK